MCSISLMKGKINNMWKGQLQKALLIILMSLVVATFVFSEYSINTVKAATAGYSVTGNLPSAFVNYYTLFNVNKGDNVSITITSSIGSGRYLGFQSDILFSNLTVAKSVSSVSWDGYYPGNPHVYQFVAQVAGNYYLQVYGATSAMNYTITSSHKVSSVVLTPVQADFSWSPSDAKAGAKVTFADASRGSPSTWMWNFGDGIANNTQNPDHIYANAGSFTVTLTVTNPAGSSSNFSKQIQVLASSNPPADQNNPPPADSGNSPHADFTVDLKVILATDRVAFTDRSTGSPTSWLWDFGDGSTSNNQNTSHSYQSAGTYVVTLTVSNQYGNDIMTNYITVNPFVKPVAKFTVDNSVNEYGVVGAVVGETIQYRDLSENTVTSWLWDFGDGTTSDQQNPHHVYQQEGNYTVTLTVSNSAGSDKIEIENYISVASNEFKLALSSELNLTLRSLVTLLVGASVLSVVRRAKKSQSK
jgi:PKD repeat protein